MKNIKNKLAILSLILTGAFALSSCTSLNNKTVLTHAQSNQSGYVQVDSGKLFYKKFGSGSF
jgi:starvation-inducible outer membrane lipoprotein